MGFLADFFTDFSSTFTDFESIETTKEEQGSVKGELRRRTMVTEWNLKRPITGNPAKDFAGHGLRWGPSRMGSLLGQACPRYFPSILPKGLLSRFGDPMSSSNKVRRYPRVRLPKGTLVAWEHAGIRKVSAVTVLALGGLFIATAAPPPIGEFIKLVLEVPGGEVRARAMVCDSKQGKGMGIEFKSMGQDSRARLSEAMKTLTKV
jgi:hypothetical protein